jgi:hypothetical protein
VIKRTGQKPRTVTADRGYGEAAVEDELYELGIPNIVIPRKGRPSNARQAQERQRAFRRHLKWRTGCEGRISHLKRNYRWDRTMIDSTEGARIWTGHGVLAHTWSRSAPRPTDITRTLRAPTPRPGGGPPGSDETNACDYFRSKELGLRLPQLRQRPTRSRRGPDQSGGGIDAPFAHIFENCQWRQR